MCGLTPAVVGPGVAQVEGPARGVLEGHVDLRAHAHARRERELEHALAVARAVARAGGQRGLPRHARGERGAHSKAQVHRQAWR